MELPAAVPLTEALQALLTGVHPEQLQRQDHLPARQ
jgi:hypothetical protein